MIPRGVERSRPVGAAGFSPPYAGGAVFGLRLKSGCLDRFAGRRIDARRPPRFPRELVTSVKPSWGALAPPLKDSPPNVSALKDNRTVRPT